MAQHTHYHYYHHYNHSHHCHYYHHPLPPPPLYQPTNLPEPAALHTRASVRAAAPSKHQLFCTSTPHTLSTAFTTLSTPRERERERQTETHTDPALQRLLDITALRYRSGTGDHTASNDASITASPGAEGLSRGALVGFATERASSSSSRLQPPPPLPCLGSRHNHHHHHISQNKNLTVNPTSRSLTSSGRGLK